MKIKIKKKNIKQKEEFIIVKIVDVNYKILLYQDKITIL